MWTGITIGSACVFTGGVIYKYLYKKKYQIRTIIDTFTIEEMDLFLNTITKKEDDGDTISLKLLKLYKTFTPSERQLQVMSQLQQKYSNTGGRYNFISTTLYAIATLSVMETFDMQKANHDVLGNLPPSFSFST
tara:strand:+ start:140 stop:541 length:402 start_codon:yes stop_codon:yes gene_type:complete